MKFSTLLFLLVGLFAGYDVEAARGIIRGTDTTYCGQEIKFKYYLDEISASEAVLAKDTVDQSGIFTLEFTIEDVTYVFADCGKYRLYFFLEPGKDYHIILPPRMDKTQEDKLNPFFKPIIAHLGTNAFDEKELNVQIRIFNDAYIPFYNKHLEDVYYKKDFSALDVDIKKMDKPFVNSKHEYFNQYRRYRYGLLRYLAYQQKSKSISDEYFKNQAVLVNNPAYMELFNLLYNRYFQHFTRTEEGKQLASNLSDDKDIAIIRKTLAINEVLQPDDLLNLVILKGLFDEFYDDNYSRSSLLEVLEGFIANTDNALLVDIAKSIRNKVTRLMVGFEPPQFKLLDRYGKLVGLDQFKGKFVYLNFCTCFSYSCLNEFAMLQTLYAKHKEYLEIVTVIADDNQEIMKDFLERSQYPWTFLHDGLQPELLEEYDIRAFPTYYLLDNEGKLILSPAPSPQEEFEGRLFMILRAQGVL